MKPRLFIFAAMILIVACNINDGNPGKEKLSISFKLSMEDPSSHYLDVIMEVENFDADTIYLKLPVWTPGYYKILDFPQYIAGFTPVSKSGDTLDWVKAGKNCWQVTGFDGGSLSVVYHVFANRTSVAESYMDTVKAFVSPTGVFMHVEGYKNTPVELSIEPWVKWEKVSTGLHRADGSSIKFTAEDFDELYDCPILIGNQEVLEFEARGKPHYLAIQEPGDADRERLKSDLKRIVETSTELIGDIPYDKYEFIIMPRGGGGLEHCNSMAVFSNISSYPGNRPQTGWLGFMAHEFFHLYNVKRIRPEVLGPFDYDRENLTTMLWFSEGGTVYYQEIILNRAGFITADQFLDAMESNIRAHENIPGKMFQSAAQSSWDTWINFFSRNENSREVTINYYSKGCTLCMLLDLAIRHESGNNKSLDDVMRTLYYDYHKGMDRGFTDDEFRMECEKAAGTSLPEIFDDYVATTQEIDYPKYLAFAGLAIDLSPEGDPEMVLGKEFRKRSFEISVMEEMDDLQKKIFESWLN